MKTIKYLHILKTIKPYLLLLLCFLSFTALSQTVADSSFIEENIKFKSGADSLAGTIYIPRKPYAAIVLIHGSGQEKRMVKMAMLLAKNGIAVLTYDKRGVGQSGGVYVGPEVGTNNIDSTNLDLLAVDASAAANALLLNLPRNHGPLGLMGFSQAGWVIPLAAEKNNNVNFMVLFSGPVINTLEQLRFQFFTQGNTKFWDTHTESEAREHIRNDADRYQFTATDPQKSLAKLSIKGLWLFGEKDIQVPVNVSIEHLNELKAKGKLYEYRLFPELGHNTSSSKTPEPTVAAIQWIKTLGNSNKK
ncbi:alpha/beta hydrolase family protein [Pedobacter nototheniae]|uniref:alpha/beta hydrolase family protein n=1 Tax=Pedobacter nototheniae TaxID=2488994 RepID=UPI00104086B5|nr:alpha/beta fold hydrolase [Pedobacter nototheniae]